MNTAKKLEDLERKARKIESEILQKESQLDSVRVEIGELEQRQSQVDSMLADLEVQKRDIEARLKSLHS